MDENMNQNNSYEGGYQAPQQPHQQYQASQQPYQQYQAPQQPYQQYQAPQQPYQQYQAPQQPYQTPQPFQQPYQQPVNPVDPGKGLGVAAMVLGIINIVFCLTLTFPLSLIGLPLGCVGLSKSKKAGMNNGMAVAGIVMNAIGLALYLVFIILSILTATGVVFIPFLNELLYEFY